MSATPTHRGRSVLCLGAFVLMLGACMEEPPRAATLEPANEAASSATTNASDPTQPPGGPDDGKGDGKGGDIGGVDNVDAEVEAELTDATEGFYAAITEAYSRVDPAGIEAASTPGCVACQRYVEAIAARAATGEEYREPGEYQLDEIVVTELPDADSDVASVAFVRTHTGLTVVDEAGTVIHDSESSTKQVQLRFRRIDGQWLVTEELYL